MHDKAELIELARLAAATWGLDAAVVCAVCEHESSWNPLETHFEPGWFEQLTKPGQKVAVHSPVKDRITEIAELSLSWGLMQVLGVTARDLHCAEPWLAALAADPALGLEWGCRVFRDKLEHSAGDIRVALLKYNGGGDRNYPGTVLEIAKKYA